MDEMSNYVASGWKRDLTYIIGCCWVAQVGSLDRDEWQVAIHKFLVVMVKRKTSEWTDIKELMPLQFMPYVAKLFREVTGKDLQASASSLVGSAKGATTTGEWPSKAYSISSPTSKGSRCLGHLMPTLVVNLSH